MPNVLIDNRGIVTVCRGVAAFETLATGQMQQGNRAIAGQQGNRLCINYPIAQRLQQTNRTMQIANML